MARDQGGKILSAVATFPDGDSEIPYHASLRSNRPTARALTLVLRASLARRERPLAGAATGCDRRPFGAVSADTRLDT